MADPFWFLKTNDHTNDGCLETTRLWLLKQRIGQCSTDFINEIERANMIARIPADQLHRVALNGLRPEIRRQIVVARHPESLAELRELTQRAEETLLDDRNVQYRDLNETLHDMSELIKILQAQSERRDNSRSPDARRDVQQFEHAHDEGDSDASQTTPELRRTIAEEESQHICPGCGVGAYSEHLCPARDRVCFKCGNMGHYKKMCQSARRKAKRRQRKKRQSTSDRGSGDIVCVNADVNVEKDISNEVRHTSTPHEQTISAVETTLPESASSTVQAPSERLSHEFGPWYCDRRSSPWKIVYRGTSERKCMI